MVMIEIQKKIKSVYTYEDGEKIYRMIAKELENNNKIEVSFSGIDSIPSSFANGCFVKLLEQFGFEKIKKCLIISNSTKQINQMIKSRLTFESERLAKGKNH